MTRDEFFSAYIATVQNLFCLRMTVFFYGVPCLIFNLLQLSLTWSGRWHRVKLILLSLSSGFCVEMAKTTKYKQNFSSVWQTQRNEQSLVDSTPSLQVSPFCWLALCPSYYEWVSMQYGRISRKICQEAHITAWNACNFKHTYKQIDTTSLCLPQPVSHS